MILIDVKPNGENKKIILFKDLRNKKTRTK